MSGRSVPESMQAVLSATQRQWDAVARNLPDVWPVLLAVLAFGFLWDLLRRDSGGPTDFDLGCGGDGDGGD